MRDYAQRSAMSSPKALHSHTVALTPDQAETLRTVLAGEGFDFEQKPYMLYAARNGRLIGAVLKKGRKPGFKARDWRSSSLLYLSRAYWGRLAWDTRR